MRNIYIIGAQSTGKTTLVDALESRLGIRAAATHEVRARKPPVIREVARTVLKEKGFNREDITTSRARALQLQQHILEAQYTAELETSTSDASSWYICDRSGLDPIVYAKCFVGTEAAAAMLGSRSWLQLESRMKAGIVILCEAGCRWLVDDGIRLMPGDAEEWLRIDDAFRDLLNMRGIDFSIVPKDLADIEERVDLVERLLDASCK
ncbi:hypothetical protein CC86DRAFT_298303 [Ophiobolus disseminans]|uniref:NadR/Ttd14 AAA domain-containing protein n=1 Tax=Ophiobolus disseminans TaxID=1469910 RepID=A0A6A6ZRI0_9PLEO|nr:hypothetical protein CC86DRAFT_298303 [Ophiobolus disseminans]